MEQKIYWTTFQHGEIDFIVGATEDGLCYTGGLHKDVTELTKWVQKRFEKCEIVENAKKLEPYIQQFHEYFDGTRTHFDLPFFYRGTSFQESIWRALQNIPYVETCSYSDIAQRINNPKAVRAVGGAIGANPILIIVPCHRVLGKDGSLTGFSAGIELKKVLLEVEGIRNWK